MCGQTNYEGAPQVPYEQRQNPVKETTARYWQVLGEWLSQSAVPPGRPSAGLIAGVIICSSYQTFFIARLLFVGTPADGTAFHLSGVWYGAILLAVAVIGSAAVLIASSRAPLTVLGVECVLHVVGSALGMENYFVFPLLFALFSCITRSLAWIAATGILTVLVAMVASSLIVARPGTFGAEFVGQLITAAAFAAVGIATRSVRAWRSSSRRVRTAQAQAQHYEYERDEAIVRARIAEELHDSVGHGLTTIAALAEGLSGVTGDARFDEVLDGINQVARESLEDTRRAVHRLSAATHVSECLDVAHIKTGAIVDAGNGESRFRYRHWDDIVPILDHVRSLGVTVIFTETGRRQEHLEHSHLCFSITRESLTNAIRHTTCLERVTVSWDHSEKATRITVRNDGVERSLPSRADSQHAPGTGLRRLQRQVEQTGGSLSSGYEDNADWVLVADVLVPDKEVGHP